MDEPPKKCYRHRWVLLDWPGVPAITQCALCNKVKDEARSRRGRLNKNRGRAIEREVCEMLGWMPIGGANGPADGIGMTSLTIGQVKSGGRFPGWMATELDRLPRTGGRVPVLAIAETPGPGKKRRVLVVLEARDWVDLHG